MLLFLDEQKTVQLLDLFERFLTLSNKAHDLELACSHKQGFATWECCDQHRELLQESEEISKAAKEFSELYPIDDSNANEPLSLNWWRHHGITLPQTNNKTAKYTFFEKKVIYLACQATDHSKLEVGNLVGHYDIEELCEIDEIREDTALISDLEYQYEVNLEDLFDPYAAMKIAEELSKIKSLIRIKTQIKIAQVLKQVGDLMSATEN